MNHSAARHTALASLAMLAAFLLSGHPLAHALRAAPSAAVPQLQVSPFGYRMTQIQPVPGNPRAFDVSSRAGVCGDAANDVSGRLTSSSPYFVVLDGDVSFGNVSRTSCLRPTISRDTFSLRIILPTAGDLRHLSEWISALFNSLSWSLACSTCGSNHPPVANAGPDQTAYIGQTIVLDGTRSTDVDGDPLTYSWSLASRPAGSAAGITASSQSIAGLIPDIPGEYVVHLVVSDGIVASTPDVAIVSTLNSRPVADAGGDLTALVGNTVRLDGSRSTDVDADPLTFRWSLVLAPADSRAALEGAATAAPTLAIDRPGTYVAQLIVNDGTVDSEPDTVTISTINSAPHADAGSAQTVRWNTTVLLDGRSSSDADGDVLRYAWSMLSRPDGSQAALQDPGTPNSWFLADRPGLYVVQLIVNDGTVDSGPVTITVAATNQSPFASDDSARTVAGTPVDVDVLANDTDGDGDALSIVSVSAPAHGTADVAAGRVHYSPAAGFEGVDTFSYTATDGVDSATAIVTISVGAVVPPPEPVARLELSPSAVLLRTVDEIRALEVRAFDAAGVPTFVPSQALEYVNSNEQQIQVVNGVVQALVMPGSALVRVRLTNDPSIVSAPVAVTAADVNPEVTVIADEEIVDEPAPVDVGDRRYEVRLNRAFDAGALILNSGGKPVMGQVVAVDPMAADGSFRTEVRLVPLNTIFQNLVLSYSFTPEELSGLTQAEGAQLFAAQKARTAARLAAAAAEAPTSAGACGLEFSSTELTGDVGGHITASLGFDLDLAITEGSLERFKVIASGSVEGSLSLTASIGAAIEVEGSCKKKLATILVPIGGPLSLLVGARVPLGFSGSLALQVQQNLATIEVAQDLQADLVLGVFYQGGQFIPVNMLNVGTTPATTLVDIPASSLRFRGKAFLGGTAGISLGVLGTGFPLFDLAEVSGGPQFEARFGDPYDASTDTAYTPGYDLKVVGKAGPGADITNAFKEIFGAVPPPFDLTLQLEFPWASSPQPGAVLKADRAAFAAGDTVTFRVDLAPGSESFPFVGYNVSEVRVYFRDEASSSARLVASTPGVPGKTSFELPWTADRDGRTVDPTSGRDNFFAFVVPVLLSTPSASYPLELGAVRGVAPIEIIPRDVVVGVGGTRQFSARVDGEDSMNVTWTATGGTISSSGFFQAGNIPGTYTVMVARADAPGVTDEATVEVRPHCVPGSGAGYCGFNYATVPLPGPFVWQSIGVNDNGDWVGVAEDGNGVRSVYIGRGNSFALAPGLNPPAGSTPFGVDRRIFPKLTNNNAFAGSFVTTTNTFRAFVFQNGAPTFLDPLPGDLDALAYDVNEDLVVVGASFGQGGTRAVRWVNGVAEDLGLGTPSTAFAIDAHGRILVTTGDLHFLRQTSIQVWNEGAVTTLPDSQECQGVDINSSGDVVGTCIIDRSDPAHPVAAAFVWRNGDRQALDGAVALNDSGDVLATYGLPGSSQRLWRDGVEHDIDRTGTYLSTPPNMANWLFTSLSPTKSILAGWSITCPTVTSCFSNVLIAYPIELVVP
jgi:Big-like domain-containing protein/K319-like protein/PKD domain-containing protein